MVGSLLGETPELTDHQRAFLDDFSRGLKAGRREKVNRPLDISQVMGG